MAGFVFKLESFLSIKEKLEEKAKTDYGKAISKLEQEKSILEQLENKKLQTIKDFKSSIQTNIMPNQIKNLNEFIILIDKKIENQNQVIQKAYEFSEEKRKELINSKKDRKIFEALKEKEKEAYMKDILQKEQKLVDEIVSYKYNKGN